MRVFHAIAATVASVHSARDVSNSQAPSAETAAAETNCAVALGNSGTFRQKQGSRDQAQHPYECQQQALEPGGAFERRVPHDQSHACHTQPQAKQLARAQRLMQQSDAEDRGQQWGQRLHQRDLGSRRQQQRRNQCR